ncbi:50S ribosomal protein L24 [Candidatus Bathyarchaeota archaeon]|nr:MAG: 50S ribosomal protein L24 [Candidatus Bathyarchaeota archaeon]
MALTASAKPRKQRRALYTMPHHRRHKLLSAMLSGELREKYGFRSLPVRVGDRVRVMRGDFKGVTGRVIRVDRARGRIYIDAVTRTKVDGSTTYIPIHASKVMIIDLNLKDKWRKKVVERKMKAAAPEAVEEVEAGGEERS